MTALERKVQELARAVLGVDAVTCLDAEHVIDRVIEKWNALDPDAKADDGTPRATLESIKNLVEEAEGDLSYIRMRLDDVERSLRPKPPAAKAATT